MNNLQLTNPKFYADGIFELLDVSEATRADYKARINLFLDFVTDNGFNRNSFLSYKRYLKDRTDYSISTKNKYLISARVFLKELCRQGKLPFDMAMGIKQFTQSKLHKKDGLNEDEISLVVNYLEKRPNTPKMTRIKAIFSLLIFQGLRQVEIVRLDVSDLDLVSKTALVLGKGRDDKEIIDLHPETVKGLRVYLKTNNVKSGALFQSQSNNSKGKRITTRSLSRMVKKILNKLEIEKSTHGFRHYFTTSLVKKYQGDLLEVAAYTRHRSLESLQVYFDRTKKDADLPRYYKTFSGLNFNGN